MLRLGGSPSRVRRATVERMSQPPVPAAPAPQRTPSLVREPSGRAIAGVATGLARHLGVRVAWVRLAFVALVLFDGVGVLLYAALWLLVPPATAAPRPLGIDAATRRGARTSSVSPPPVDGTMVFHVGAIALGVWWVLITAGVFPAEVLWPVTLAGAGVVLLWLQADRAALSSSEMAGLGRWTKLTQGRSAASVLRLVGGLALVALGVSWVLASQVGPAQLPAVLAAALALLAGVVVVVAPWIFRGWQRLRTADQDRVRAAAQADMAAHLHDSVLQTLALIQRQSQDATTVSRLARQQERELRTWLYGEPPRPSSIKGALDGVVADVEAAFPVSVEAVCVGDAEMDERLQHLVAAAREAAWNAAKHSGADRVDIFAEVEEGRVELFVRDRGSGFDETRVPADRRGVRESIQARMARHDGAARIRSVPGEGTEVRLEMSR